MIIRKLCADENIEQIIEEGEREHERIAKGMRHTVAGKAILTPDHDWQRHLKLFERTAKRLASTDQAVVATAKHPSGTVYRLTALGNDIRSLCVNALPLVERAKLGFYLKGHSYLKPDGAVAGIAEGMPYTLIHALPNPHITVMLRACMQIAKRLARYWRVEWGNVNEPTVRAAFERAAEFVRRTCRSERFRTVLKNHQRSVKKNLKSYLDYVESLFEQHSKLLVLRIDLYIHPDYHEWSASDRAEWCLNQYLRALHEGGIIDPEVKGWIVKREGGFDRGFHFHLMVFLDGHKHKEGHLYSRQLGEAWSRRFSDGKGTYFSCWALRKKYRYNALGVVHISDWKMLTGIRIAVTYIVKNDCALETGRSRNLRRGIRRRLAGKPKPGAPRKAGNDLSVVMRVFAACSARSL